jgi:hypothetical protein
MPRIADQRRPTLPWRAHPPSVAAFRTAGNRLSSCSRAPCALCALGCAVSRDALQQLPPSVVHRRCFTAAPRITRSRLAAVNRLADFRLRREVAVLQRRPPTDVPATRVRAPFHRRDDHAMHRHPSQGGLAPPIAEGSSKCPRTGLNPQREPRFCTNSRWRAI